MELMTCKILVLVLLGVIKLVSGLMPMLITKILRKKSRQCLNRLIGVVLCLGGGVLLSTVFLHILPEVRETLERSRAVGLLRLREEYPVAELFLCLGFLAIFLIETVVCKLFGLGHSHGHGLGGDSEMSVSVNSSKNNAQGSGRPDDPMVPMVHSHNETSQPVRSLPFIGATQFESDKNVYNVSSATLVFSTSFSDLTLDTIAGPPSSPSKYLRRLKFVSSIRTFLVVLALSIHSVFEGMAIGLQENERGVWKLFIAVSVHATAIMFCIGMEMISTGMRKLQIGFYVAVLAAVTPIGVTIGLMVRLDVDQSAESDVLVIGILQGVAGGTLLYITFFEVLDREKLAKYKMSGMVGILFILVGFGAMASLEVLGGHSHLEGGHGHLHIDGGHGYDHLHGGKGHVHGFDHLDGGQGHVHADEVHGFDHLHGVHGHVHADERHEHDHLNGGHGHVHVDEGHGDEVHGDNHVSGGNGHVQMGEGHGDDHLDGDHGHVHSDEGHGDDHFSGSRGHVHTDEVHGDDHLDGGHGHVHADEGHGDDHLNSGRGHVHIDDGQGEDQNNGGRRHGHAHIHGDHGHIAGEEGHDHGGGGHGNAHKLADHRFDPVRQDHAKNKHGDDHTKDTTTKDQHGDAHAKGMHGNAPTSTEARGDNIGQVVEHERHSDINLKAPKHEHNVSVELQNLLRDSKTFGHEHDASHDGIHEHNDNIKDDEAFSHTHHADQDVELKDNDHLETEEHVHNHGDALEQGQIHTKKSNNEDERKLDGGVLVKDPVGINNSEIEEDNIEQKGKQDTISSHGILDHKSNHSDRQTSPNQVLNKENNGGNKSQSPVKLLDESKKKSESNPSNTKQVDDKETMLNDTINFDNGNEVISSEDHLILTDKEGGHVNDTSETEDGSVLSSLGGQVDRSHQNENETHSKGDFNPDKSETNVLTDDNDRSGTKSDDATALKLDNITDVHKEDKLDYNQTTNSSDTNPIVHQEVFSDQSKASVNSNTIEEETVVLNNSELVGDINDNFEEVPILNNTSEVFFDYNEIVDNVEEVKEEGDSPPLELTFDDNDIVFIEESTDDKPSKSSTRENVKPDIDSNKHDVGIDNSGVANDKQDIENENKNIDSVKNHVESDKPKPWWAAFF